MSLAIPMAYRPTFDCLWCGVAWTTRGPNDLEGWAQLCPDCLGKAGSNPFLRGRLRAALAQRVSVEQASSAAAAAVAHHAAAAHHAAPGAVAGSGGAPRVATRSVPRLPGRLVPAPRPVRARRHPRRRVGGGARHGHALARRPAARRADRGAGRRGGLLLAAARRAWRAVRLRRGRRGPRPRPRPAARASPARPPARGGPMGRGAGGDTGAGAGAGAEGPAWATRPTSWSPRSWWAASAAPASTTPPPRCGPASAPAGSSPSWTSIRTPPAARPLAWPGRWHEPALLEAALRRAGFSDLRMAETGRFFLTASAVAR